jgi:hypothetical protein
MERKAKRRELWYNSTGVNFVLANLSVNHTDYGMSPSEHEQAKRDLENIS